MLLEANSCSKYAHVPCLARSELRGRTKVYKSVSGAELARAG